MSITRDHAISTLRATHDQLMSGFEAQRAGGWDAPLVSGTWRVRDLAAHIAIWDRLLADAIVALPSGAVPEWLFWDDATTDEANDRYVRDAAAWSVDRLRQELRSSRDAVIAAIMPLDDARFVAVYRSGDQEASVEQLCEFWINHDRSHFDDLPEHA